MKTVFSIVMLIIFGSIALFLLAIARIPGTLLTLKPKWQSRGRIIIGTIIATLGQSYIYLACVAFIISWTTLASRRNDVVGFLLWPVAFIAVASPLVANLFYAYGVEEEHHEKANVVGSYITLIVSLVGFFIFAFAPTVKSMAWGWVPYNRALVSYNIKKDIWASTNSFFSGIDILSNAHKLVQAMPSSKDMLGDYVKIGTLLDESKNEFLKCDIKIMNSTHDGWGDILSTKAIPAIDFYLKGLLPSGDDKDWTRGDALVLDFNRWMDSNLNSLLARLKEKYKFEIEIGQPVQRFP
jgi:hypothetical protein